MIFPIKIKELLDKLASYTFKIPLKRINFQINMIKMLDLQTLTAVRVDPQIFLDQSQLFKLLGEFQLLDLIHLKIERDDISHLINNQVIRITRIFKLQHHRQLIIIKSIKIKGIYLIRPISSHL